MNDSKTEEYIIFGNAFQRQKCVSNTVYVGNSTVSAKDSIIYLGAILDSQLNLKEHIKSKCQKAVYNIHCINNIKRHLSIESKKNRNKYIIIFIIIIIVFLIRFESKEVKQKKTTMKTAWRMKTIVFSVVLGLILIGVLLTLVLLVTKVQGK